MLTRATFHEQFTESELDEMSAKETMNTTQDERKGLPSASRAWLYDACPGSYRLMGEAGEEREDGDGAAASGTRVHAIVAGMDGVTSPDGGSGIEAGEVELAQKCRALRAGDMPFDPEEVRIEDRLFSAKCDFTGKPDYVGLSGIVGERYHAAYIVDYKTGAWVYPKAPDQNEQLRILVALCHQNYGIVEGKASLIMPRQRPQVSSWNFGPKDVFAAVAWMNDLAARVNEPEAKRHPGDHCKWCPARHACPEGTNWATALLPASMEPKTVLAAVAMLTPEQLAKVWEKKKTALKIFEAIDERLKGMSGTQLAEVGLCLHPGAVREKVTDPIELWHRCQGVGMDEASFLSAVTVAKGKLEIAVAAATGRTGDRLSATLDMLLDGLTESTQTAPTIKKI